MASNKIEGAEIESIFQYLHKEYISLRDEDMKSYVNHFRKVLDELVTRMKKEDPLFNTIYSRIDGAGSYFDGLKVAKPEEFDMDVVIRLPVNYKEIEIVNDNVTPAFTKVGIGKKGMDALRQHTRWTEVYRFMDSWIDEKGFLLQTEFRSWMESVVSKALNTLEKNENEGNFYKLTISDPDDKNKKTTYLISFTKSGPAMTFHVTIPPRDGNATVKIDVDFVPVIEFTHPHHWPPKHVRKLPENMKRKSWFVVPKPKKAGKEDGTIWRLAFNEQEREMINDKGNLKPVCRMLKKFRDETGMNIASYYLKTLFLWELDSEKNIPFFRRSRQGILYLHMLKKLEHSLDIGKIPYYWDKRYDLLEGISCDTKGNLLGRVRNVVAEIEKKIEENPLIIAKRMLTKEEFQKLETNFVKAAVLTPATPVVVASSPANNTKQKITQECKTSAKTDGASMSQPNTKSKNELPCSTCINMMSKMDKMLKLLTDLHTKVENLENTVQKLTEENIAFRDQLKLQQMSFNSPRAFDLHTICNGVEEAHNLLPLEVTLQEAGPSCMVAPCGDF